MSISGDRVAPIQVDSNVLSELRGETKSISEAIQEHISDFRTFVTKLMGDDKTEQPQGRIPRLEAGHANHERRIRRIETLIVAAAGGLLLVKGIAALVEFASRIYSLVVK